MSVFYGVGGARRVCISCVKGGVKECIGCVGCFVCQTRLKLS